MLIKNVIMIFLLFAIPSLQTNKYVSTKFEVKKHTIDKATILIFLKTANGIHINSEPKPDLKFDDNSGVEIISIKFEKTAENYIDIGKPITIEVKLNSKSLKVLKGKFTCFYCSETEGWCSKLITNFTLELK